MVPPELSLKHSEEVGKERKEVVGKDLGKFLGKMKFTVFQEVKEAGRRTKDEAAEDLEPPTH